MEHCVSMKDHSIYAGMLVAAVLHGLGALAPCAAQQPAAPSPERARAVPAAAEAGNGQDRRNLPAPLPDRAGPTGGTRGDNVSITPGRSPLNLPLDLQAAP